ncbi:MAG: O-antigen ligase family protein [Chloroflexi bacterium]|nr:O-antigen ligase family protein [Chloroflexota bacterium]
MSTSLSHRATNGLTFSAAPPVVNGPLSRPTLVKALLGLILVLVVGVIPLPWMVAVYGALVLLIAMVISPMIGLYAVLSAIPFSPTFGLEDAAFSISAFEPLLLLVILFWLLQGLARKQIELPREGLFGSMALLLALLFLAGGFAESLPLAFKETLKWVLLVLAYVYTRVTIRDEQAARAVLAALFFAGAGQAFMGLVQFAVPLGPPGFAIGPFMRAHGMFGQPNPFAGYLGTIFPIALAMVLIPHPGRFRWIAVGCAAMIGLGIFLSLSRGSWLGLAISLGIMGLVWSPRARRLVPPLIGILALTVVLSILGLLPPAIASRITSVTENFGIFDVRDVPPTSDNFAVVERMAHWQAGWYILRDYPFLGVGPGNYPTAYERYYIPPWREALGHAHNYYLNMAAEAGIPGMLALLLVLGMAFRGLKRRIQATSPSALARGDVALDPPYAPAFTRALALGLLGSLAVFCIHNLFDNLLVHGVGIQIGVLLGLIGGVSHR